MVFKWHNSDYWKLANEDEVRAAIRNAKPAPGLYMMPRCTDMKEMASPEMQQKFMEGPIAMLTVRPSGKPDMRKSLIQWFALNLFIATVCAHLAAWTQPVGAVGHPVFHLVAILTFLAYGGGSIQGGIWMGLPWRAVLKDLLDALIFAVLSGLVFALLWPH
jgi:hypothetical protein